MPIRKSSNSGIPFGQDAGRPQSPLAGQPFFNGDAARLELYTTATGWQNIVQETPAVVGVAGVYAESQASNVITINGTNFASGCIAYATGTNNVEIQAVTTSLVSVVQIDATFSGLSRLYEPYDVKVVNPSNLYGIMYDTLQIDDTPVWNVQSGSLGTYIEQSPMSISTGAVDDESQTISYSVSSGSLPGGLSLNSSTGVISGTPSDIIPNTTYSFTLDAFDGHNHTTRNYSISITDRGPTWNTLTNLAPFTKNSAYSTTLSATDDNSGTVAYSLVSGSFPAGISLSSSGVISGTATTSMATTFTIRATDPSGNYTDRQFVLANVGPNWITASGAIDQTTLNSAYSYQLSATDDSGISPSYSIVSGSLPSGLSLSSSGLISGTVTGGNYSAPFIVRATDNNGVYVDRSFSISVMTLSALTSSGTFVVPTNITSIDYLVVAGGGSGSGYNSTNVAGAGGGAGGVIAVSSYSVTPGQNISYTIGAGASGQQAQGDSSSGFRGGNTTFGPTTATGGGGGVQWNDNSGQRDGGSGGGAHANAAAGTGISGQGNNGYYTASQYRGGGGGGKGAAASSETGGIGIVWNGISVGGGGSGARGGSSDNTYFASVGYGGGSSGNANVSVAPSAGTNGTGGGGGGCGASSGATYRGANGGNGAVYVKYLG